MTKRKGISRDFQHFLREAINADNWEPSPGKGNPILQDHMSPELVAEISVFLKKQREKR
jgi:hypothetical protein